MLASKPYRLVRAIRPIAAVESLPVEHSQAYQSPAIVSNHSSQAQRAPQAESAGGSGFVGDRVDDLQCKRESKLDFGLGFGTFNRRVDTWIDNLFCEDGGGLVDATVDPTRCD